jgi:Mn-dependent DtxR family transcriptional regulator
MVRNKLQKGNAMNLQESGEMYLESIYVLTKNSKKVRSIDVVEYMGFSKPSVSRAIGLLKNGGYVTVDSDGHLALTDIGLEIAEKIYERHNILTAMLIKIGVSKETAANDACKIEHVISDESFDAIRRTLEND